MRNIASMSVEEQVRDYLVSKGFNPSGMSLIKAVRNQLNQENQMVHPRINLRLQVKLVELDPISIKSFNPHHYEQVEPRSIPEGVTSPIAGVLLDEGVSNYRLVDGYHRLKWLRQQGVKRATYILLT